MQGDPRYSQTRQLHQAMSGARSQPSMPPPTMPPPGADPSRLPGSYCVNNRLEPQIDQSRID